MRMRRGEALFSILLLHVPARWQPLAAARKQIAWSVSVKRTCCCRTEPVTEDRILDILDSPAGDGKSFITASSNQKVNSSPAWA